MNPSRYLRFISTITAKDWPLRANRFRIRLVDGGRRERVFTRVIQMLSQWISELLW